MENLHGTGKTFGDLIEGGDFGGVILTAPLSDDRHAMLQLEKSGLPFARIASMLDPGRGITVTMDENEAAREITSVLLDAGHRSKN
jgi:LacI family transcriptional regulator